MAYMTDPRTDATVLMLLPDHRAAAALLHRRAARARCRGGTRKSVPLPRAAPGDRAAHRSSRCRRPRPAIPARRLATEPPATVSVPAPLDRDIAAIEITAAGDRHERLRHRRCGEAVRRDDADKVRIAITPPATLRCSMAEAIAHWLRDDVAPIAATLGAPLGGVDEFRGLRMPWPQSRRRRADQRARQGQRARHPRADARQRQAVTSSTDIAVRRTRASG